MQMSYTPGIEADPPPACLAKHEQVMSPSLQALLRFIQLRKDPQDHQVQP